MKVFYILVCLIIYSQLEAKDKYYKWTDSEGNIHYAKKKPSNQKTDEIEVRTNQSSSNLSSKNENDLDSEEVKTPEQLAVEKFNRNERIRVKRLQDAQNSKIARKNLTTLQQTVRVRRVDPITGESIRMADTERSKMIKESMKQVRELCR